MCFLGFGAIIPSISGKLTHQIAAYRKTQMLLVMKYYLAMHKLKSRATDPPLNFVWNELFHCINLSSLLAQRLELSSSNAAVLGPFPVGHVIVKFFRSQYKFDLFWSIRLKRYYNLFFFKWGFFFRC